MRLLIVFVIAVAIAVAACGDGASPSPTREARTVTGPPLTEPASTASARTEEPTQAFVTPCSPDDLVGETARENALTGGKITTAIVVRNVSDHPCIVRGQPRLELLREDGEPIDVVQYPGCPEPLVCQPESEVIVAPGVSAFVRLEWPTYDVAPPCDPPPGIASSIELEIDGGTLTVPVSEEALVTPCKQLMVGWFESPTD